MPKLGRVNWQHVDKVLQDNGWVYKRTKGSHRSYIKAGFIRPVTLPKHKDIATGTLANIIRTSGLTKNDFV